MRLVAAAAAAVAILVFATASATAATLPVGTFSGKLATIIKEYAKLNGTWQLKFAAGGKYTISRNGLAVIHGTATAKNGRLIFGHETGPAACPASQPGTYRALPSHNGNELSFSTVSDQCVGRSIVLTSIVFKRIA